MSQPEPRTLMPVMSEHSCCGHIIWTPRGYKAYNRADVLIGVFKTAGDACVAILKAEPE